MSTTFLPGIDRCIVARGPFVPMASFVICTGSRWPMWMRAAGVVFCAPSCGTPSPM